MPYTAGTQGVQTNVASVFAATVNTALVAAGFTAVETYTVTTTTAVIYKSPAASNVFGSDWYLTTYRTADTAVLMSFGVSEVWDTGTKKMRNYALAGATRTPTASFAINDATGLAPSAAIPASVTLAAAGFQYWISATCNRVVIATRVGAADTASYMGLYDDVLPVAISPFPLVAVKLLETSPAGVGQGGATREPNTTTSTANAFGVNIFSQYQPATTASTVDLYRSTWVPGRSMLNTSRSGASGSTGLRGYLKDTAYLNTTAVNGDTIVVTDYLGATKTYTAMGSTPVMHWADQGV